MLIHQYLGMLTYSQVANGKPPRSPRSLWHRLQCCQSCANCFRRVSASSVRNWATKCNINRPKSASDEVSWPTKLGLCRTKSGSSSRSRSNSHRGSNRPHPTRPNPTLERACTRAWTAGPRCADVCGRFWTFAVVFAGFWFVFFGFAIVATLLSDCILADWAWLSATMTARVLSMGCQTADLVIHPFQLWHWVGHGSNGSSLAQ